jgi:predicted methyltransferase MtxX (methanogen marker protein 4)
MTHQARLTLPATECRRRTHDQHVVLVLLGRRYDLGAENSADEEVMKKPNLGDRIEVNGVEFRILSVVVGRVDPVTGAPAEIEGMNESGEVEFFGMDEAD